MPRERASQILGELASLGVETWQAETCQQARGLLGKKPRVDVVISDLSLADGNWCDVFKHLVDNDIHASMVVTARQADERLWSEVLWRGAYDLLVEPYGESDVRRVVEGAVRAQESIVALQMATARSSSPIAIETAAAISS
jgi:DNA-binding NtrC family response regulator